MEYPPQCGPVVWELVRSLQTGRNDENGTPLLSRAITDAERRQIYARRDELAPWMAKAEYSILKGYVVRMLVERGKEREQALARADEFVKALGAIPAWAADRACDEFGKGTATAKSIEDPDFIQGSVPEVRHVAHRARLILRPFQREWEEIGRIFCGTPDRPQLSEDDRARLGDKMREEADAMIARNALFAEDYRDRQADLIKRLGGVSRRNEWLAQGLEPPEDGPYTPTLALRLALGASIKVVKGKPVLIEPNRKG